MLVTRERAPTTDLWGWVHRRCGEKWARRHRGRRPRRRANVVGSHHASLILAQFVFVSRSLPRWAVHHLRVAHSLANLKDLEVRIRVPASRRTSTRRVVTSPPLLHVTSPVPLRMHIPPALAQEDRIRRQSAMPHPPDFLTRSRPAACPQGSSACIGCPPRPWTHTSCS